MDNLEELLDKIKIPKMIKVKQTLKSEVLEDIPKTIREEFGKSSLQDKIKKGDRIALTVGSRGIANISIIIREIVMLIKEKGACSFIVPTMGSHGGATAEGQAEILKDLGVTEDFIGVPIRSSMDVVQIGVSKNGFPICMDKYAHDEADAIIVIGRIKPHTSFRGNYESGLAKMIVIGLGKQIGAEIGHSGKVEELPRIIEEIARTAIEKSKIIIGIGIIENAYDETFKIKAVLADDIMNEEPKMLVEAKAYIPKIMFENCDVLIVDTMGKNIAGPGMDPNIIRRHYAGSVQHIPLVQRIVVLDLTKETHGNATGMGNADICTKRFLDKIDFSNTNANPLTNRLTEAVKIPMVMENDRLAIKAGIKTCSDVDYGNIRMIRIKNTLKIDEIFISESLLDEAKENPDIVILSEAEYIRFDRNDSIV